jgi:hypothetical protein
LQSNSEFVGPVYPIISSVCRVQQITRADAIRPCLSIDKLSGKASTTSTFHLVGSLPESRRETHVCYELKSIKHQPRKRRGHMQGKDRSDFVVNKSSCTTDIFNARVTRARIVCLQMGQYNDIGSRYDPLLALRIDWTSCSNTRIAKTNYVCSISNRFTLRGDVFELVAHSFSGRTEKTICKVMSSSRYVQQDCQIYRKQSASTTSHPDSMDERPSSG